MINLDQELVMLGLLSTLRESNLVRNDHDERNRPEDPRGHDALLSDTFGIRYKLNPDELPLLCEALKNKKKLDKPVRLLYGPFDSSRCRYCGEAITWVCDGLSVFSNTSCAHPDGVECALELNVPSGRIIWANDLRPHGFDLIGDGYDINTSFGCVQRSKAFEKIGCVTGFVGNTCPSIYLRTPQKDQVGERFLVANSYSENYHAKKHPKLGKVVGSIITDLWWFCAVDGGEFSRRSSGDVDTLTTKVRPGVYQFNHLVHRRGWSDEDSPVIYTEVKWLREPDPVKDYLAESNARNFTAGQVLQEAADNYPSLYGGPFAARRGADQMLCTIGNGYDWHPNGFCSSSADMDPSRKEMPIPDFSSKKYRNTPNVFDHMGEPLEESWYPLSRDYSALCRAGDGKIFLNPSFVALARNTARAIISCPKPSGGRTTSARHGLSGWKENIKLAKIALKGIDNIYDAAGLPLKGEK